MPDSIKRAGELVLYLAVLVALWWAVVKAFHVSPLVIPSPEGVWLAGSQNFRLLASSTAITLGEALAGFGTAIVAGIIIAIGIVSSRAASRFILPTLVAVNSAPKVVFAPVLVIWLGLGLWSKVGMAFLLCFFPIVINAAQGMREVDPELLDLYRLMQAGRWTTLRRVRLPNSVPYILSGLKIALPLAIIGAVIGEFVAARQGIGYQVMLAYSNSNTELVFAAVLTITVAAVVVFQLLVWAESLILVFYPVSVEARSTA
ncbi:MAG TPA: ABC transporter permease [Candidatus Binatia bacterium]|nr:ABC transporter permease [Candidatus Binatia bacterium]